MGEFKGTPGPWKIVEVQSHPSNKGEQIAFLQSDKTCFDFSAVERVDFNRAEFTANARLVSSAPDLLTALQQLVHLHMCEQEGMSSGQPSPSDWLKAVDQASEAIQKAIT